MKVEVTLSNYRDALLLNNGTPSGVYVEIPTIYETKDYGADTAVTIVIHIVTDISLGIVASWIYDKLRQGRSRSITINKREISFSDGDITKVIETSITVNS